MLCLTTVSDQISVGTIFHNKQGRHVKKGDPIFTIHVDRS
ncbi:hypothetical protein [Methanocalculus sp. MSAO_Arc2]